jgi:hypothetical protein
MSEEEVVEEFDEPDDMEDCPNCDGSGYSGHECGEDSCVCLDPIDNVVCDWCGGKG